ncbi:MAG: hypothetical protein OM95_09985 [Bdellovibrio sp. ArHS]|uniref:hypothetical protein n=1 Tax=Bdellovibrio sp. ArHS TaxID=1569284 RepID=UPI00058248DA|nr:hypothetical protein [Bdellovibrio sp. ArHS]KHD88230.1 MAG: hypothetical protein OM95_09985 [Bdellovibrio sp. ArHS]
MKWNKLASAFLLFVLGLFTSLSAQALFETRVTYGLLANNPALDPLCPSCGSAAPSVTASYGLGVDGVLTLPFPLIPGIGLRYENLSFTANGAAEYKMDYTRTALLFNWRPIDNLFFLGPIFSWGLSHSTRLKTEEGGVLKADFSSDSVKSYSLGLEGGVKLTGFVVGAEVGYLDFRWDGATDATGNAATQDINMSGTYAKIILGFSI